MTQTAPQHTTTDQHEPTLRVLLVGPASGRSLAIENVLRFSRALSLVRARSCVDALGELAFSPELDAQSAGTSTVVLVADDSVFDVDDSIAQATPRTQRARQFALAVGHVAPHASMVCAERGSVGSTIATPLADASDVVGSLLAVAQRPTTPNAIASTPDRAPNQAPTIAATVRAEPKPTADQMRLPHELLAFLSGTTDVARFEHDASGASPPTGDESLVLALLRGQSIVKPALTLIESRLGAGPVALGANPRTGATGATGSPVRVGGHTAGVLVASTNADAHDVACHGAWLGSWLALEQSVMQMRHDSFVDPLTGAFNRRFFERELPRIIDEGVRNSRSVAILAFDIDNFKSFNDRFGHEAGDEILSQTVQLLRRVIRPTDRVCRLGGDEFVVVFYDPDGPRDARLAQGMDNVMLLVDRLQKAIAQKQFPSLKLNAPGSLSISGGLASIPQDGMDPWKVLRIADSRALDSKRSGKDTITFGPAHPTR